MIYNGSPLPLKLHFLLPDQVYKIIDEDMAIPLPKTAAYDVLRDCLFTSHVTIPAAYQSGITLCVRQDNIEACQRLADAPQLPILESRKNENEEEEEEVEVVVTSKRTDGSASGAASLIP